LAWLSEQENAVFAQQVTSAMERAAARQASGMNGLLTQQTQRDVETTWGDVHGCFTLRAAATGGDQYQSGQQPRPLLPQPRRLGGLAALGPRSTGRCSIALTWFRRTPN